MNYIIKRGGTLLKSVKPTGKVTTKIMDEELLSMSFSLDHHFVFAIGDTVTAYNNIYSLQELPTVQKQSTNLFNYQLKFTGLKYELGKIQFMFPDGNNNLTLGDFSINGNAQTIIELIVQNANRISNGWTVGIVEVTDVRNFTFTAHNLLAALAILAEDFKSEFWIDQNQSIHFQKRENTSGLSLEYGKNKGLFALTRSTIDSTKVITRLYAFGSEKNISNGYRNGSARLKLPSNYLENNTETYGIIEHTEIFEDIYPHREGTVTHVNTNNPLKFRDTSIDFNLGGSLPNSLLTSKLSASKIKTSFQDVAIAQNFNVAATEVVQYVNQQNLTQVSVLIPGVSAKVTFNSGQLAGYTFDIAATGWNNLTKEITLVQNTDEKALELPNTLIRPAVGDKYVITDIIMPDSYVMAAENNLIEKASEYLQKHSRPQLQYSIVTDHLYLRRNNIQLNIGNMVHFTDIHFGLNADLRITAITQDLQNPYDVQFELSEKGSLPEILQQAIDAINKNISDYKTKRTNIKNTRIGNIKIGTIDKNFDRIGNLEAFPFDATLVSHVGGIKIKNDALDLQFRTDMTANPLQVYTSAVSKRN